MIAGARVEVAPYKKNPADFVLWKPAKKDEVGFDSPWGKGRPGWHIECSAMSVKYLGIPFDIHGGGQDLIFPHHENEIAQSCCGFGEKTFAQYWLHNGWLTFDGDKMSKSLGNIRTVHQLLEHWPGEVLRYALLSAHYRQPLDWTQALLEQSKTCLDRLYTALQEVQDVVAEATDSEQASALPHPKILAALEEDLNTPLAFSALYEQAKGLKKITDSKERRVQALQVKKAAEILGVLQETPENWFKQKTGADATLSDEEIEVLIAKREEARQNKDFSGADAIRDQLETDKLHDVEHTSHHARSDRGQRDHQAAAVDHLKHLRHERAEVFDLGPAKFIHATPGLTQDSLHGGFGDIIDINRLEPGAPTRNRQNGTKAGHSCKAVKELVFGAKHDRRPQDHCIRHMLQNSRFAGRFGPAVFAGRIRIRANRRHMYHARHALLCRDPGNAPCAFCVNSVEGIGTQLVQNANTVHDDIRPRHGHRNRGVIADIAQNRFDLPHDTIGFHMHRFVRAAHGDADTPAFFGHAARDVTPHKARTAIDGNQLGHGIGSCEIALPIELLPSHSANKAQNAAFGGQTHTLPPFLCSFFLVRPGKV